MRGLAGRTVALKASIPARVAVPARWPSRIVPIPRPCHASATAKATSASWAPVRRKRAWAMRVPASPEVTTRPPWPSASPPVWVASWAARARSVPIEKKRKQHEAGDSPSRKASRAASSSRRTGRTRTVEPSRSATSMSRSTVRKPARRARSRDARGCGPPPGRGGAGRPAPRQARAAPPLPFADDRRVLVDLVDPRSTVVTIVDGTLGAGGRGAIRVRPRSAP